MTDTVMSVEGLGKRYLIDHQQTGGSGLRHVIESAIRAPFRRRDPQAPGRRTTKEEFWALQDVSFTIRRGEALAVVGRNGSGKSTLLKLVSRITAPTRGQIRYRGRVSSLLEVGTGFHPELTGRENIFMNAALLGMRRAEIRRKFDEIVAFSEVEKFLDTPVKRYSSGMYVRLAFGVAAHLEPEILLVDEVLAVGDAAFQKKCLGKMGDVVQEGRTVMFVSHNMAAVAALCNRGLLLDSGRLGFSGSTQEVIDEYLSRARSTAGIPLAERTDREGDGQLRLTRASVMNDRKEVLETVASGQSITLALDFASPSTAPLANVTIQVKFFGLFGQPLFACLSRAAHRDPLVLAPGGRVLCRIPALPLQAGTYTYTIWCSVGDTVADLVRDAGKLEVVEGDFYGTGKLPPRQIGDFLVAHDWRVE